MMRDGTVQAVDATDSVASAVTVRQGTIVAVGSDADVAGMIGPGTRVLDLAGKTVIPGFIDSHTHNVHVGEFRYSFEQLNTAAELNPSMQDVLDKVRERAAV